MFTFLRISDFAIIEGLELELGPGLTVLSGETGAGKSIILAAVNLLLGRRADGDLIRQGSDQAVVEAQFDVSGLPDLQAALDDAGVSAEDGELVVRRLVSRQGRNRVQVSGSLATLGLLARIGPALVSISGQHAAAVLLSTERHLILLDEYAGLRDRCTQVGRAVETVRALDQEISQARESLARREQRRELLEYRVKELDDAALDPGEESGLKVERAKLANAERIASLAEGAHQGLYSAEGSASEILGRLRSGLADLAKLDPEAEGFSRQLDEAYFQIEDLAVGLQSYKASLVHDPARLDHVEGRLLEIQRITRKYGGDVASTLEALAKAKTELAALSEGEEQLTELQEQRAGALARALEIAQALSTERTKAAESFARAVEGELRQLAMEGCEFEVRLSPPGGAALETSAGPLGSRGLEQAEFFIAPNPGEGLRRLSRIASGGELSRILLAIKGLTARGRSAPTLIFDEVDQGIGGVTGNVVGAKLSALSKNFQVICITHLPQIAAWADHQLAVVKRTDSGRTQTVLQALDPEARLAELARMLGAQGDSGEALEHARRMLASAKSEKATS